MNSLDNLNSLFLPNTLDGLNANTEYIDSTALLVDGSNMMMADLNMNNFQIQNLDAGILGTDAINKSQLDVKADVTYVNTQVNNVSSTSFIYSNSVSSASFIYSNSVSSASTIYTNQRVLKSGDTMSGALTMGSNHIISSINPSLSTHMARKAYVDTKVPQSGGIDMTGNLGFSNLYRVINLVDGFNASDAATVGQINTLSNNVSSASFIYSNSVSSASNIYSNSVSSTSFIYSNNVSSSSKIYTDTMVNNASSASKIYIDTQDNLRVLKSGDTMTGQLNIAPSGTTPTANQFFHLTMNSNGLWFNPYFSAGSWNGLMGEGDKGIIFSNGTPNTGNLIIGPWGNSKGIKINGNSGQTSVNKIACNYISVYTFTGLYALFGGSTIYDYFICADNTCVFYVPFTGDSDTSMVNKTIYIDLSNVDGVNFWGQAGTNPIIVNGVSNVVFGFPTNYGPGLSTPYLKVEGSSTIGTYTITWFFWELPTTSDQLIIKSNYGINPTASSTEFTGIKFENSNTDAGFIRVDTSVNHNDSNMSFQVRQGNSITNPLTLNSTIIANVPINANNDILINGATSSFQSGTVDVANRTNTYLTFKPAGSTNDWAYLRQIGGENDFHLSLDIHDDAFDGKFSLRSVESTASPDNIKTFFKATATRGYFNPECLLVRDDGDTSAVNLDNFKGVTTIHYRGDQHGDLTLPSTSENGVRIEIMNCSAQNITIKRAGSHTINGGLSPNATSVLMGRPETMVLIFKDGVWYGTKWNTEYF